MEPLEFVSKLRSTSIKDDKERYWRTIVYCFLVDNLEQIPLASLPKYFIKYYERPPENSGKLSALLQEPEFEFICVPKIITTAIWLLPSDFLKHVLSNLANTDNKMTNSVNNNTMSRRANSSNPFAMDAQKQTEVPDQNDEARFGRLTLEEFKCGICLELLKDTVEGSCCKNLFCLPCIEQNGRKCPNCRKVVEWTANEPIRRLIGKKPVQCDYKECKAWSTISEIEQHQDKCEFNPVNMLVSCEKCQQQIMRRLIEEHLSNICEMVEVPCPSCGIIIVRKNLAYHESQVCEYRRVLCAHGCGDHMTYKEYMDTHFDRCTHQLIKCTNQNCNIRLQRRRILEHLKDCKHSILECPNEFRGCDVTHIRANKVALQKHIEVCRYRVVTCPHGCGKQLQKRKLKNHSCDYRPMQCIYCAEFFAKKDLVGHWKICPSRMVECDLCKKQISCVLLEHHKKACPERNMTCPKCDEHVRARLMTHHEDYVCLRRLVNCDRCDASVVFHSFADHKANQCPDRPVKCSKCEKICSARKLEAHQLQQCPYSSMDCYKCGQAICTIDYLRHTFNCSGNVKCEKCGMKVLHCSLKYHQCQLPKDDFVKLNWALTLLFFFVVAVYKYFFK